MISYLSHKQIDDGYKRKKMTNPANAVVRTDVNPGEMEIAEVEGRLGFAKLKSAIK